MRHLLALALLAGGAAGGAEPARSGFDFMSRPLQAMQRDDTLNPGMLWVQDGLARWSQSAGTAGKSCADCHGATPDVAMRGVAARYPAWDETAGTVLNLADRIALCRRRHQHAEPWEPDSEPALGLAAAVALASRGLQVVPPADPRLDAARSAGERLWRQRIGQLDLACADCHDRLAGRRLGGSVIPPGSANGYPTYRLEWQALGSLARRIRNCMTGVRAEPLAPDSAELRALEAYLALRDRGLAMESPAVRP